MENVASGLTVTGIYAVMVYKREAGVLHKAFGTENHTCHQMVYMLSGATRVHFIEAEGVETAGSIRFMPKGKYPPGSQYYVDSLDPEQDALCIDIYFDTDREISREMFICDFPNDKALRGLFEQIYQVWYRKREGYYCKSMALLYQILEKLEKKQAGYLPEAQYGKIRPAVEYMEEHFQDGNLSCADLAKHCGISYSYFKRLFLLRFNLTPVQYIQEKRLRHACDLLVTGRYTVTEVAERTGFENVYYFSRVFKQKIGVPPSEYARVKE